MRSLRSRLLLLWAVSLLAALAAGAPLIALYLAQGRALEGREDLRQSRACDVIADRYAYFVAGWSGPPDTGTAEPVTADPELRTGLAAIIALALRAVPGVEAGIWQQDAGIVAPADTDPTLRDAVAAAAAAALGEERDTTMHLDSGGSTLLVRACPLAGPIRGLAAFVFARADSAPGLGQARIGIAVLAGLVLATTIGVGIVLAGYTRTIAAIETALTATGPALARLPLTGERDLDRIVVAYNRAGESLDAARAREAQLAARMTAAERLAALGRVAAGVAHEIRNPIAAMRLRAENALAGDAARREAALSAILVQIDRLDRLAGELLDMTRARAPAPVPVDLRAFLSGIAPERAEIDAPDATLLLDPTLLQRALGNLLANAARAAGADGRIGLRATLAGDRLSLIVSDTGPGIPDALRDTLFEPFVTGHADGTGLGLAIAREAASALGGTIALTASSPAGASFTMVIPVAWPAS